MTLKEQVQALKGKFQAKLNESSTPEEIQEVNDIVAELDSIDSAHDELLQEHAKTKEAVVRMVVNQGNGDKPKDDVDGSKPKTIEECVAEELQKGGK